jgi:GNAT superfamily N-acetyltransferase
MSSTHKTIFINKAKSHEFDEVFQCIKELAEFEKAPHLVSNSVEKMLAEKDYFHCFIARNQVGDLLGIALYFFAYYTWVGKSLYLDDIYVKKQHRNNGVGKALLHKIFETAKHEQCARVRFQVLNWNTNAIEFYKKEGACLDDEWVNCNFDEVFIQKWAL